MRTVFIPIRYVALLFMSCLVVGPLAAQSVLDNYIREALQKSPLLYQDSLGLQKSQLSKSIAQSYYLPTADFQFGYQTSAGGRQIDLPVGDMLNGVYSTLNQITGNNLFPHIQNQSIHFFPQNFYDAKVRTTVPVFNPELKHQVRLATDQVKGSEINIQIKKRELIKEVKSAYYNYLLSRKAAKIYQDALTVAREGLRVNERLLKNGKGLPAYVMRSRAEVGGIQSEIYQAEMQSTNAKALFNFLLNRDAAEPVDTAFDEEAALKYCYELAGDDPEPANREEVKALANASAIYQDMIQLNKSASQPRLNGILDLGSQAENWKVNNQSTYFLLGLQLEVPIYSASRNKKKVIQSQLDLRQNESKKEYVARQLELSAQTAINELKSALQSIGAKEKQLEAASTYQRLIDKGYAEGVSTFIETIDARNQWTQAQISYKIQLYKAFRAAAAVERELGRYPIQTIY